MSIKLTYNENDVQNSRFPLSIRANNLAVIIRLIMYPLVESRRADKTGLGQLHRSKLNFFPL